MKVSKAKKIQLNIRDREIYRLHTNPKIALTLDELGRRYNLSRQRIGQIVTEQMEKIINKQSS